MSYTTTNDHDAAALYRVYCDSVGGKAYDGKPLPNWETFSSDPTKEKQAEAWRDVAHFAFYASEREKSQKLKAEVARLQMELDGTCNAEELRQTREERKKAEAEVAELNRLMVGWKQRATMSETTLESTQKDLRRAIEIAQEFWDSIPSAECNLLRELLAELDAIKATLSTQQPNSPTA